MPEDLDPLEALTAIFGKENVFFIDEDSFATGTITLDPHHGELSCTCGNVTGRDGFVACDENGIECDPLPGWNGRYLCQQCGATITLTEQQFKDAGLL